MTISISMHQYLIFSFLLLFLSYFMSTPAADGVGQAIDGYHTFNVNSLLPKNKCSAPLGGGSRGLPITYNYGPCSRSGRKKSTARIFLQDQSRVRSINARKRKSYTQYSTQESSEAGRSPNSPELYLDHHGYFLVEVGIGTPLNNFPLIIDTGSPLTWVKCNSCSSKENCPKENGTFIPSSSTSYSFGSCIPYTDKNYTENYKDHSSSEGFIGCDEFTLDPDVFPNFQFGCSHKISGDFGDASGILGLAQSDQSYSLLSQTFSKFNKEFSYCLPPAQHSEGYLLLGHKTISSSPLLKFTPLLDPPSEFASCGYYFIEMNGISVAGKRLNVSNSLLASPGTIIDSGTVITRLPSTAYQVLRDVFRQEMLQYPSVPQPKEKLLETCYNLRGRLGDVKLPNIVLHFREGVDVSLDKAGILWGEDGTQACLAFAPKDSDSDLTIIGNRQQLSLKVAYDVEGRRLGFGDGQGCIN